MAWEIDQSHTSVQFAAEHMGLALVRGQFRKMSGTLEIDEQDLTRTRLEGRVEVASVDTNNERRDEHLRAVDFFDVQNHPYITFKIDRIRHIRGAKYKVQGTLTIRGVTCPVTMDGVFLGTTTDGRGRGKMGFRLGTKINRKDFGLPYSQTTPVGVLIAAQEIMISIEGEATKVS